MQKKWNSNFLILNLIMAFFIVIGIQQLTAQSKVSRLSEDTSGSDMFRSQVLHEDMLKYIKTTKDPGEDLGLYWLETGFGYHRFEYPMERQSFAELKKKWHKNKNWKEYLDICEAVWNDVKYFPVPEPQNGVEAEISFADSWMMERNYGGKRGHEGTDIMASENVRGFYPIVSMTDGEIVHKGWLEQGGYRLGIQAPGGGYFYYAHLDSYADIQEGDAIKAGDIIGYMGDTGYNKTEGTTGNFPVHLHVGIYVFPNGIEKSVNPYWVLRSVENRKLKCVYF